MGQAGLQPAADSIPFIGVQLRWAHRPEVYVPPLRLQPSMVASSFRPL